MQDSLKAPSVFSPRLGQIPTSRKRLAGLSHHITSHVAPAQLLLLSCPNKRRRIQDLSTLFCSAASLISIFCLFGLFSGPYSCLANAHYYTVEHFSSRLRLPSNARWNNPRSRLDNNRTGSSLFTTPVMAVTMVRIYCDFHLMCANGCFALRRKCSCMSSPAQRRMTSSDSEFR